MASRAVLIGTGTFQDSKLPDIPAVRANLDAIRRTLTHPVHGVFAPEHCMVVDNPRDQITVGAALSLAVREAEDLLLVYYCGHGLLDDYGLLHFALTESESENVGFSAINLDLVKRMVGEARAEARVLVLDCCFSGKAVSAMAGPDDLALGQLSLTGTYTLTSTTATAPSHARPGAAHTAFTGAMLQALTVPGPLTLDEVHRHVDRELAGLGLPRPQRRSVGAVGDLSLVRGPARDTQAAANLDQTRAETEPTLLPERPPEPDVSGKEIDLRRDEGLDLIKTVCEPPAGEEDIHAEAPDQSYLGVVRGETPENSATSVFSDPGSPDNEEPSGEPAGKVNTESLLDILAEATTWPLFGAALRQLRDRAETADAFPLTAMAKLAYGSAYDNNEGAREEMELRAESWLNGKPVYLDSLLPLVIGMGQATRKPRRLSRPASVILSVTFVQTCRRILSAESGPKQLHPLRAPVARMSAPVQAVSVTKVPAPVQTAPVAEVPAPIQTVSIARMSGLVQAALAAEVPAPAPVARMSAREQVSGGRRAVAWTGALVTPVLLGEVAAAWTASVQADPGIAVVKLVLFALGGLAAICIVMVCGVSAVEAALGTTGEKEVSPAGNFLVYAGMVTFSAGLSVPWIIGTDVLGHWLADLVGLLP
ncbi:caspase family protein [Streptomyces sp. NPDC057966]|uniref:caspase family protein n=1 Tax=Streptomyces sp. NPDC057966 TaxID=3346292 RepID=UPI0036E91C22